MNPLLRIHCLFLAAIASLPTARAIQPFEVVILGDTQQYYRYAATGAPDLFRMQTQWVRDHVASRNIAFLTHVGDVTYENNAHWPVADANVDLLDGQLPYSITFGNHDTGAPSFFGSARYAGYPWHLGSSSDQMAHAQTFSSGGFTLLHINLPHACTAAQRTWAAGIITAHPGKPTIISTHGYMFDNGSGRAATGQNIWNDLVNPYPQVFMTCNGHDWVTRHEMDTTTDGRKIIQVQVDWQQIINGGNGLLQIARFDPDNGKIDFSSYSPYLDLEHTDYSGRFAIGTTFNQPANTIQITGELGPAQRTWTGGGSDANWQTAANWGGTAPAADQLLIFNGTVKKTSTNNFPIGTRFAGMVFRPGTFSNGYIFSGNRMVLGGDIVNMGGYGPDGAPGAGPVINLPLTLEGDRQINTGDWDLTIGGVINGPGSLTKTHGRDYLRGSYDGGVFRGDLFLKAVNTYAGNTRVTGGALILEHASATNLMPNSPVIELFPNAVLKTTGLPGGVFQLAASQTLSGTGKVQGKVSAPSGSIISPGHAAPAPLLFLDNLTLAAGSAVKARLNGPAASSRLDVTGTVALGGARLDLTGFGGYVPAVGEQITLVSNDGTDAIGGNFTSGLGSSLAPGSPLTEGVIVSNDFLGSGFSAYLTYLGGSGNDATLVVFSAGPPVFLTDPLAALSAPVGAPLQGSLRDSVTHYNPQTLVFTKISGPAWLRVGPGGSLTGTPSAGDLGVNQFTVQVSDGQGGTDTAVLPVQVEASKLVGRWDFNDPGNLTKATVGTNLQLVGTAQAMAGRHAFDGAVKIGPGSHFRCTHNIGANGGGTRSNEYTLVFDISSPPESATQWIALFQANPANTDDAECFIRNTQRTVGRATTGYSAWAMPQQTWTRIAVSVDHGSFYRIYANGVRILSGNIQPVDGEFALQPVTLLFGDEDGEDNFIDVTSVSAYRGALSDAEIAALEITEEDPDRDGMPSNWELAHSLNPSLADGAQDADQDGLSNYAEFVSGSDPQSGASVFAAQLEPVPNSAARILSVATRTDRYYSILHSDTLAPGSWNLDAGPFRGTGAMALHTDPGTAPRRFFKVLVELP